MPLADQKLMSSKDDGEQSDATNGRIILLRILWTKKAKEFVKVSSKKEVKLYKEQQFDVLAGVSCSNE